MTAAAAFAPQVTAYDLQLGPTGPGDVENVVSTGGRVTLAVRFSLAA